MRYLSDEWFDAANSAVGQASPAPAELVIDQHIDEEVAWRVVIGTASSIRRLAGEAAPAAGSSDAIFHQLCQTAASIARGEADSHQAFLLGDVRFEGDIDRIIERREALEWLHSALEPVMAQTVWD